MSKEITKQQIDDIFLPQPDMIVGKEGAGTSVIMKDVETGLKYKVVIRNGELRVEGAEPTSIRDKKIKTILE